MFYLMMHSTHFIYGNMTLERERERGGEGKREGGVGKERGRGGEREAGVG